MESDKEKPQDEGSHDEQLRNAQQKAAAARARIEELYDSHRIGADMDELEDFVQAAWMTQQSAESEIKRLSRKQSSARKMARWVWQRFSRKNHR